MSCPRSSLLCQLPAVNGLAPANSLPCLQQTLAFLYQTGNPLKPGGWFPQGFSFTSVLCVCYCHHCLRLIKRMWLQASTASSAQPLLQH